MRVRAKHLQFAHYALETWASWRHTHTGQNGVMGALVSAYSPDRSSLPKGSAVPPMDMPKDISRTDMIVSDSPSNHKLIIENKYMNMKKVSRYADERMLEYISGRLIVNT